MAKVTQEQKLAALKGWLKENEIEYLENYQSGFGVTMDVKIPSLLIAIFVSNGDRKWEQARYAARKGGKPLFKKYKPFFIRPADTQAFTLEKIANCCYDQQMMLFKRWKRTEEEKGKKEAGK